MFDFPQAEVTLPQCFFGTMENNNYLGIERKTVIVIMTTYKVFEWITLLYFQWLPYISKRNERMDEVSRERLVLKWVKCDFFNDPLNCWRLTRTNLGCFKMRNEGRGKHVQWVRLDRRERRGEKQGGRRKCNYPLRHSALCPSQ